MSKACEICGKSQMAGGRVQRRGLAKKKGGSGKWIISRSNRVFKPNLQRVRALVDNKPKQIWVCTRCIKAGHIAKAPRGKQSR
jgi:large subunit ribosomal protein L28